MKDREIGPRPSPSDVWRSLAVCAVCDEDVMLVPIMFPTAMTAMTALPAPLRHDGHRAIAGALYFRDPFHNPRRPFENYCSALCSVVGHR